MQITINTDIRSNNTKLCSHLKLCYYKKVVNATLFRVIASLRLCFVSHGVPHSHRSNWTQWSTQHHCRQATCVGGVSNTTIGHLSSNRCSRGLCSCDMYYETHPPPSQTPTPWLTAARITTTSDIARLNFSLTGTLY